jgi:hypothetical protein
MARYALLQNGTVVNVIEAGPNFSMPGFSKVASETAQIGWTYANGQFTDPNSGEEQPLPVPASITRRQLLLQLQRAGWITTSEAVAAATSGAVPTLLGNVLAGMTTEEADEARITWAAMSQAERTNPLLIAAATVAGASEEDLDDFFRAAAVL